MSKILIAALVFGFGIFTAAVIAVGISFSWQWLLLLPLIPILYAIYQNLSERPGMFLDDKETSISGIKGGKAYHEGILDEYEDEEE